MNAEATILVATDVVSDAETVRGLLRDEFENVVVSTAPDQAVQDFEKYRPTALILAFKSLEKAERYYLGLYRLSSSIHVLPHRTLILCGKDDLRRVYELCKREYFDDYVLFWPMTNDTPRLPMAIHHILRQAAEANSPGSAEVAAQARRLAELEALLDQYVQDGDRHVEAVSRSLRRAEEGVGAALDSFSRRLSEGAHSGWIEIKDSGGLQREINRLKTEEIESRLRSVATAAQPVKQWAASLKVGLSAQVAAAQALNKLAEQFRPLMLVVDDDELQHKILKHILSELAVEPVFATSGTQALALLGKRRPDLILMDVDLPNMDGIETTRRIKSVERFATIPVVMITGYSEKGVVLESMKAGASGFVVKPFDKEILGTKITMLLHGSPI